ncbi:hypothetical protein [Aquimarina celericrescens]|uniref:Uncharacterized protein n=1 Tax=Aquimarina celericrescens TaxID=1964542 RepID=A0ABW5AVW7_9FLAO|nr:hypothetical protein [Aquimarina celericrescens]
MKTLILSIINGLFTKEVREPKKLHGNSVFITATEPIIGRTIIIEQDSYSIWVYLLTPNKLEIDFDGFLCSVVTPVKPNGTLKDFTIKEQPLPIEFSNKYSFIKNLNKEDIKIDWQENQVILSIKEEVFLIMNMETKTSYSKSLSCNCPYGKSLTKEMLT